jgi:nucleoside-diphosphate-sugar epimerase
VATEGDVSEQSPTNPQTAYAVCKTLVERDLTAMADSTFCPTFMRNATAFGVSPRLRFDLVVQNLSGLAWTTNTIAMTSDGSPWRPLVHARDIAQAVACVLAAPAEVVNAEVFNVGSSEQNYQVRDVAEAVGKVFPECKVTFGTQGADNRSYRVDFTKISTKLPGFECQWNLEKGVRELYDTFRQVGLTNEQFESRDYTRLAQLEYLRSTGQVDDDLRWTIR